MGYGADGSFIQDQSPSFAGELEKAGIAVDAEALEQTEKLKNFATVARALKAKCNLGSKRDVRLLVMPVDDGNLLKSNTEKLKKLIGAASIELVGQQPEMPASLCDLGTVYIDVRGNVDAGAELARLGKEREKLENAIKAARARLANQAFVSKAPANVIEGAKKQLSENEAKLAEILKIIGGLKA